MCSRGCFVVASGPSAAGFVPPDGVTVIAVNGAIRWLKRADFWFTLDPSPANISYTLPPMRGCYYYCAAPSRYKLPPHVIRLKRIEGTKGRWSQVDGLSTEGISTGNSAYGAVGLAYRLGYKRVALVGVDATDEPRVDGTGKPNDLSHLPALMASALPQIEIVSCGKLASVPQMTLQEACKWLTKS